MRTSMLQAVLAVAVLGIACTDDTTPPVTEWTATLTGADEVPAVTTAAAGTATFALNATGDSIIYTVNITTALDSTVTQAHIHSGNAGANGNVAIWLCETTTNPAPTGDPAPTCGTGTVPYVLAAGRTAVSATVLTSMRVFGTYANVHTLRNTGGAIRGQLRIVAP